MSERKKERKRASMTVVSDGGNGTVNEPLLNSIIVDGEGSSSSSSIIVEGVVDYRGERVINRSKIGGWRSAYFIIGAEMGETIAFYGVATNLITYLTGPLHQSTAIAAANVNAWIGVGWMLPLLGAFIADSYLGRYRTILFSFLIYVVGLGLLTLSVVLPSHCNNDRENNTSCTSSFQVFFFFLSLYLVAVGKAGFKPCAQAFGADQFDVQNPEECKSKSSFFNWWYFGLCIGCTMSRLILTYIEENLSWGLGFGISCIFMAVSFIVFLLGTKNYRYSVKEDEENPLFRIARVFIAAAKNWRTTPSSATIQEKEVGMSNRNRVGVHQFKFLEKALLDISKDSVSSKKHGISCSIVQVEDAKVVLRLVPIWFTGLIYAVVVAQSTTFFTKQGNTMDRSIGPSFQIPAASLQTFISLSTIVFIPIYEHVFVPLARAFTGKPNGLTMLQRVGTGLFFSILSMVVAALVEEKRLQVSLDSGLIDKPKETIPMSLWWLVPQYFMFGAIEVFTMVGLQEFFYDQMPDGLRSVGLSLYFSMFGIGDIFSGLLVFAIEKITSGSGQYSWFSDNLNRAHLDYFYWLLAGLSAINLAAYLYFSKYYLYNRRSSI